MPFGYKKKEKKRVKPHTKLATFFQIYFRFFDTKQKHGNRTHFRRPIHKKNLQNTLRRADRTGPSRQFAKPHGVRAKKHANHAQIQAARMFITCRPVYTSIVRARTLVRVHSPAKLQDFVGVHVQNCYVLFLLSAAISKRVRHEHHH